MSRVVHGDINRVCLQQSKISRQNFFYRRFFIDLKINEKQKKKARVRFDALTLNTNKEFNLFI